MIDGFKALPLKTVNTVAEKLEFQQQIICQAYFLNTSLISKEKVKYIQLAHRFIGGPG
jgi:hypothetical protein